MPCWAAECRNLRLGEEREGKEGETVVNGDEHGPCPL